METISLDENSILIIIKSKSYHEIYYQIVPSIAYSGRELFPYEDKSLFNQLNIHEDHFDLILIGKKILKHQIDSIKSEILQKTVCEISHHIFEYDGIFDTMTNIDVNYNRISVDGSYKGNITEYLFFNNLWTENINNV